MHGNIKWFAAEKFEAAAKIQCFTWPKIFSTWINLKGRLEHVDEEVVS